MQLDDLTPQQDSAFAYLRRRHNANNPDAQITKAQLIQRYATRCFDGAINEADRLTRSTLKERYAAASPAVQAQVDALLESR